MSGVISIRLFPDIFIGISVVFAQLSLLIADLFKPVFRGARNTLDSLFPRSGIDIDGNGTDDFQVPREPLLYYSKNLLGPILAIVSIQCFFAAIFCAIEGWDFGTAMYHCLVTATTVGYGDISIETDSGCMWAFVHIAISVSLLGTLIGDISDVRNQRLTALKKVELLKGSLNIELMKSLDRDGDGVDKFEFVIGMLDKLEMIDMESVNVFVMLFESMDADKSGKLTKHDVELLHKHPEQRRRSEALEAIKKRSKTAKQAIIENPYMEPVVSELENAANTVQSAASELADTIFRGDTNAEATRLSTK